MNKRGWVTVTLGLVVVAGLASQFACAQEPPKVPDGVIVRAGYKLTVAATIRGARFMEVGPKGELYVSRPQQGGIDCCLDKDGDGYFETVTPFVTGRPTAHGMFWHDGWLWFTQTQAVLRAQDTDGDGKSDQVVTVLGEDKLPGRTGHWWRSILIHKDRLYTGVGDPGNITDETNTKREKVWSYALDGSDEKPFCSGLRNTEKLVIRPGTEEIWGMDHGSDWFGRNVERRDSAAGQPITDLLPPDEMNHLTLGGFYGHPFLVGNRIPRLETLDKADLPALAAKTIPPEWCTHGHWAPNAMEFYAADQFPGAKGDAFVAYHGSWNSTRPVGYCVTRVVFEDGHPYGEQKYVSFLTADDKVLGRPVDCAVALDGSLLISDDQGGRVYRLSWVGER